MIQWGEKVLRIQINIPYFINSYNYYTDQDDKIDNTL